MKKLSKKDIAHCRRMAKYADELAASAASLIAYGQDNIERWYGPELYQSLLDGENIAGIISRAARSVLASQKEQKP